MTNESAEEGADTGSETGAASLAVARVRDGLDAGRVAAVVLAAVGAVIAVAVAVDVFPYRSINHDEGVYLQQADMLLSGRLFLRPPVDDAFRPWFFVDSERGLYSKYAPLPAATFAVGKLLGGYAVALAGIAAGVVAGTVALGRELFDTRVGALAGVLLLATPLFVVHSGLFLPYALTTALNVAFAVWYLRGERRASRRDAALAGVAVGLAFFARPYTAVLFALPFLAHAAWTLATSGAWRTPFGSLVESTPGRARELFVRRLTTAALGTAGVLAALGYNAIVTGDPLVFPYLAFAAADGIGFGERAILGHEVEYTLSLGIETNRIVLTELFTEWVVAGSLGSAAAATGVALTLAGRVPTSNEADATNRTGRVRRGLLAATVATVAVGNVAFWGNYNLLGALAVPTDGLIYYLGPYYHYDVIVPAAVFAAVACVAGVDALGARLPAVVAAQDALTVTTEQARVVAVGLLIVAAAIGGAVSVAAVEAPVDRNAAVSSELRDGYDPFVDNSDVGTAVPTNAVVFLPTPYGPWLNHPFQLLRNDADVDGETVYALADTRELAVANAYPDRDLYRYVYTGSWTPTDEESVLGALREVDRVSGDELLVSATLDRPDSVAGTTVRVTGDAGSAYLVATDDGGPLELTVSIRDGRLLVSGDALDPTGDQSDDRAATLPLADRDEIHLEVFVATGEGSGYSYQIDFPVERIGDGTVTALSPTVQRCPVPSRCVPVGVGERRVDRGADVSLSASV